MFDFLTTPQHGTTLAFYVIGTIVVFAAIMALIHPTSSAFKRRLTMTLAFLAGSFYLVEFLMPGKIYTGQSISLAGEHYSALVRSVAPGSLAATAGLQPGDYVTAWNGKPTPDSDAVDEAVQNAPAGPVTITARRNRADVPLKFTMPALPDPKAPDGKPNPDPVARRLFYEDGTPRLGAFTAFLGMSLQEPIHNPFSPYLEPLANAQNIILSLAIMLGIVNLFRINGRLVARRRAGWHNGVVFFIGFFSMLAFGFLNYYYPASMPAADAAKLHGLPAFFAAHRTQSTGWYNVLFEGAFSALGATSFSLLAFYIVSAAYRSFRVRSPEAILLLLSALIMMLGLTPLGTKFVTGWIPLSSPGHPSTLEWLKLENVSEWILTVLNGAAQRALIFGIAVGLLATSLRIWLSLERGQFFEAEM